MKKSVEEQDKLKKSVFALEHALSFEKKARDDQFYFSGISKSFEVCLEYAWKYFKKRATDEGLEVYSPRDAIKMAGKMKMIDDVEKWLVFLNDRNIAVHDYLGMSDEEYLDTAKSFLNEAKKLIK
jgi:nucleotidyltransferase substrate binding protein (TIGR01987 family)